MNPEEGARAGLDAITTDIRCDFCKIAVVRLEKRFSGATFKSEDAVEEQLGSFCEEYYDGGIAEQLFKREKYVIAHNPTTFKWVIKNPGEEKPDEDEDWMKIIKKSVMSVCSRIVDDNAESMASKMLKQAKKNKIGREFLYDKLCVSVSKACPKGGGKSEL